MKEIFWLKRAINDRVALLNYIAQDKPKAAIKQGDRIERYVSALQDQPEIGRAGRVAGTRELVISRTPFIAVYRLNNDRIEVLRLVRDEEQSPN